MGATESSQRNLTMKNDDFSKLPPIQITRRVLNRLEEEASRPRSPSVEMSAPKPENGNKGSDTDTGVSNFPQKNNIPSNSTNPETPPEKSFEYFPFKENFNATDPLLQQKREWHNERCIAHLDDVVIGVGRGGLPTIETVSAVQVRQEKEEELHRNDLFWESRIQKLMDHYNASIKFAHTEFLSKLEEVQKNYPAPKPSECQNLQRLLDQCYVQNGDKVLKCSDLVQRFTRCVNCEVKETTLLEVPSNQSNDVKLANELKQKKKLFKY